MNKELRTKPAKPLLVSDKVHQLVRIAAAQLDKHIYVLAEEGLEYAAKMLWQPQIDAKAAQMIGDIEKQEETQSVERAAQYTLLADKYEADQREFYRCRYHKMTKPVYGGPLKRVQKPAELVELEKEFGSVDEQMTMEGITLKQWIAEREAEPGVVK